MAPRECGNNGIGPTLRCRGAGPRLGAGGSAFRLDRRADVGGGSEVLAVRGLGVGLYLDRVGSVPLQPRDGLRGCCGRVALERLIALLELDGVVLQVTGDGRALPGDLEACGGGGGLQRGGLTSLHRRCRTQGGADELGGICGGSLVLLVAGDSVGFDLDRVGGLFLQTGGGDFPGGGRVALERLAALLDVHRISGERARDCRCSPGCGDAAGGRGERQRGRRCGLYVVCGNGGRGPRLRVRGGGGASFPVQGNDAGSHLKGVGGVLGQPGDDEVVVVVRGGVEHPVGASLLLDGDGVIEDVDTPDPGIAPVQAGSIGLDPPHLECRRGDDLPGRGHAASWLHRCCLGGGSGQHPRGHAAS